MELQNSCFQNTDFCRTPFTVCSYIYTIFVEFFPELITHQVVYIFLVLQIGYHPHPQGYVSLDKRMAKTFLCCHLFKKKSCSGNEELAWQMLGYYFLFSIKIHDDILQVYVIYKLEL